MERSYRIGGLIVNMDVHRVTDRHSKNYEIEYTDKPDLYISQELAESKGFRYTHPVASFCEYTATGAYFYHEMPKFDGLLLHSSAVLIDGKAYLFTADAGTGKSTHSALYRRVYGDDRARILNDDKPLLRLENGEFVAYGTPWSGKTDMNLNLRAPVGGICVLRRGEKNVIRKMPPREALFSLLGQTIRPKEPELMEKVMYLMNELLKQVNVWEMHCNMEPEAAIVSYETMSGIRKEDTK